MEKEPRKQLPLDDEGLAYIPDEVLEVNCGKEHCADRDVACPDRHHIYPKCLRSLGRIANRFIMANPENIAELLRCQHNYLHAVYEVPDLPPIDVMKSKIARRG